MYVLKKETKRRNSSLRTGGGSPKQINFSPLEENLLEFLTPEAAGLQDIPEGGLYVDKNQNFDSQENTIEYSDERMEEHEQNENVAPNTNVTPIQCASISKTNIFQSMILTLQLYFYINVYIQSLFSELSVIDKRILNVTFQSIKWLL